MRCALHSGVSPPKFVAPILPLGPALSLVPAQSHARSLSCPRCCLLSIFLARTFSVLLPRVLFFS